MGENNERQPLSSYNLLKIMAVFMVVAVHMMNVVELVPPGDLRAFHFHEVVRTVLLTSNGLFFMLSGRFLLEHYDGRMWNFYWKRIVKIGIPVAAVSFFYYWYVYGRAGMDYSFWKGFIKDFLQSHIQGYLWFVYTLAGFYLAVPFLARLFSSLEKKERAALTGITILYFFVQNLYQIFELEMVFTSYPFYSWIFYCILGYLLDSMELTGKQKNRLILSGIPAFLVSAWEVCFWERENPALHNYSLTMIVMTTAVYLTVTTYGKPLAQSFAKGVNWIAGRSFFLYLMHGWTQMLIFSKVAGRAKGWLCWIFLSALSFLMALGIGWILERLYLPLSQCLLKKKGEKQR